jgi:hypothetical protein
MKVFYSPEHQVHDPENEFTNAGAIPYPECARRATGIAATLSSDPSFEIEMPETIAPIALETIHDTGYLHFLAQVYAGLKIPHGRTNADDFSVARPGPASSNPQSTSRLLRI